MSTFKSGLPLKPTEVEQKPNLDETLGRFQAAIDRKIAKRNRRRGMHQSYVARPSAQTVANTKRMLGERE